MKKRIQFGDLVITPDNKEGTVHGSGGLGSNRVKVLDVYKKFVGYYNLEDLRLLPFSRKKD